MREWFDHNTPALMMAAVVLALLGSGYQGYERQKDAAAYWAMRVDLYRCTDDCSGHRAGYDWAGKSDIESLDECRGKSQSFIDGCKAYVYEQMDMDPIE